MSIKETTVNVELKDSSNHPFSIIGNFCERDDSWLVELSTGNLEIGGNRRLRLAVLRLCELDFAIELALRRGQTVQRVVNRLSKSIDGPHTATEQILPLLLPSYISDNLYEYQRQGVAWLLRHNRAILGDDMGLGKTAQALAGARRLVRSGEIEWALVVAPRTLITNWVAEAKNWAPELTIATALPLGTEREERWSKLVRRAHILVTSYEQIQQPTESVLCHPPDLIIVDEAHRLRNFGSRSTLGFRRIKAKRVWALTGTPLERDAEDLTVLLSLLDPVKFSRADRSLPAATIRSRLRPYLLRRRKSELLKELPTVIEDNEVLDLSKEQESAYVNAISEYRRISTSTNLLPLINQLRLLCDVEPTTGASSKLDRTVELICDIVQMQEKVVVFSYVLEPLSHLKQRLSQGNSPIRSVTLTGKMNLENRTKAIDMFKSDPQLHVLLASMRVASEGLTLTEANHVIFINQWWNPSSNYQARDRVVRIGQKKVVTVKFFTCKGTIEERLQRILEKKSLSFDEIIETLSESKENLLLLKVD